MGKFEWIKKVLVLGSGAIRIGQAGEFDYSGSQCLKAIREEGIDTVLINPNIATIQTDPQLAGKVYLLPLLPDFIEKVIAKEQPDSIMLAFGGQTALNCGVELAEKGVFEKYNVKVLGTPIKAIQDTEDRELFRQAMFKAGVKIAKSKSATTLEEALAIAREIGYPIIIRVAYTLGGKGSGVARNEKEFIELVKVGLSQSMIRQILVEEYLDIPNWKEIEYEVVRDYEDNCITVCNMENFDPLGVHTGDSIVIAPSQTLTNSEYHVLRDASIRVIRQLGIVGECNIQYGLHALSEGFRAIEVNARLSRSSALASKATGYPLAYIAAKLALGYTLPELMNKVTNITTACFEPALDYLVVKIPRWDTIKFRGEVSRRIGSQMKSVGEVMAIGRNFEEGFQKAIRMLEIGKLGLVGNPDDITDTPINQLKKELTEPTDGRFFKVIEALKRGISIDEIFQLTGIDRWFLYKMRHVVEIEKELYEFDMLHDNEKLAALLTKAKKYGFSDIQISKCLKLDDLSIRRLRQRNSINPVIKQIDTLAAEWPAQTNYLYATYGGTSNDLEFNKNNKQKIIVLGSGTYRIGSSVEFDWGSVNLVWALKKLGVDEVIMYNNNPETVSTDYDISDKLYFEEMTLERVLDIYEKENPYGIVVSVGGQTPNNLAPKLAIAREYYKTRHVNILGTLGKNIDKAEDRSKFSSILDQLNIKQPEWNALSTLEEAQNFAEKVGFPVLIRPSYVLSGAAMRVAYSAQQLRDYLQYAASISEDYPVVISKYIENAREVEVDAISDGEDVLIGAVIEHVENAGIHSGDASMSIPPLTIESAVKSNIQSYTREIAKALQIRGPFNVQYIVKDSEVFVIECNLRSSRSMPYVSKTTGVNLMEIAAHVMLNKKLRDIGILETPEITYSSVKIPQFSFMRLQGADPILGVEMVSTGEVACIGEDFYEAMLKGLLAAEFEVPLHGGNVLITVGGNLKQMVVPLAKKLHKLGYKLFATEHTAEIFAINKIPATILHKIKEPERKPNILDYLIDRSIDLIINIPVTRTLEKMLDILEDEYEIRRRAVEFNIPVITNLELANALIIALEKAQRRDFTIIPLNEYLDKLPYTYWSGLE
ncbi:MAG TPA: carbamoyl-phosphate synthase (glutamine-hydrolyzing) large subunit [Candidatus Deferrimicrobium sp.]|nr:carbamoyl-phosphate synthase (glutamine-hydrolyzing) large subunit [Candidatus Deferrimicrobium sp.]